MRDLLLIVILATLIPLIIMRPWVGILAWFWSGLMAPHLLTWGFMRTFPIAQLIIAVTLIALVIAKDRRSIPMTREMVTMFVFALYTAMTSYFAVNPGGAWEFWQHFMKILLVTFLTPILIYGRHRILLLLLVITFSIGFYGFKGGIFTIMTGGGNMVLGPKGSYLSGNTFIGLAMIMVLPLILVSARLFHQNWEDFGSALVARWTKQIGLAIYGVFWLTVLSIIFTYSRGALLGLLAISPFMFKAMKRKGLMVTLAVLAFVVVGVSAPERLTSRWQTIENFEEDHSAMQRIQSWGVNLNMALERPIRGTGFSNLAMGVDWWLSYANFIGEWGLTKHSPHSIYFNVLGAHGFGGLAVFMALAGFTYFTLRRIRIATKDSANRRWMSEYAWALQVSLIGYFAAGTFLDVPYFTLYYAIIALAVIMRRELEDTEVLSEDSLKPDEDIGQAPPSKIRFPNFVPTIPSDDGVNDKGRQTLPAKAQKNGTFETKGF